MATSAFKSNTKRTTNLPPDQQKPRLRRSLSVSAISRSSSTQQQQQIELEFLNKRDNPLYWSTGGGGGGGGSPTGDINNNIQNSTPTSAVASGGVVERGRSVNRNSDSKNGGQKVDVSSRRRSLSRVNGGVQNLRRGRSISRANLASESEAEQESRIFFARGGRNGSSIRASTTTEKLLVSKSSRPSRNTSHSSSFDSHVSNWEDGVSTSSLSEAEEKTIKAVYEQMKSFEGEISRKNNGSSEIYETVRSEVRRAIADIQDDLQDAIRRNNGGALINTELDITDISPKLVKPGAVELVLDIRRREYAKELEEAHERARKLRSDLAIEEHRKQELSRIIKETLPEPKTSTSHRSRLGRKSSSERKKMSKRLTDEALSYFDECVSISTFDSSDFSAAEDPSVNSAAITPPKRATTHPNHIIDQQKIHGDLGSSSVTNSSSSEVLIDSVDVITDNTECDKKCRFSFGQKPTEGVELQHDLKTYIKTFEKDKGTNGIFLERSRENYNVDAYNVLDVNESLLFDKVLFRNRQESGSLHICGRIDVPFLPLGQLF